MAGIVIIIIINQRLKVTYLYLFLTVVTLYQRVQLELLGYIK